MKLRLLSVSGLLLVFCILAPQIANACGCGIAISDSKVFSALKETQAYLLIDVKNKTSYTEMPFFRFISLDGPQNVDLVFPLRQIPDAVDGKKMSADDFLSQYGVLQAEETGINQRLSNVTKALSGNMLLGSNGVLVLGMAAFSVGQLSGAAGGPEAHFEFEGGTLDIYSVATARTLSEFVKTLNVSITDKVKELVARYQDYYVAVLKLKVPSAVAEADLAYLKSCTPNGLEKVNQKLTTQTEFTYDEVGHLTDEGLRGSTCDQRGKKILADYISAATYASGNVEGTLVKMQFNNSNSFFYPTSVVSSYKYPIKDQRYYIKIPEQLQVKLSSSKIASTASVNGDRWYRIRSTEHDLQGTIMPASLATQLKDAWKKALLMLFNYAGQVGFVVSLLALILPLAIFFRKDNLGIGFIIGAIITWLAGGLLLTALLSGIKHKSRLARTYFLIWALQMAVFLISLIIVYGSST